MGCGGTLGYCHIKTLAISRFIQTPDSFGFVKAITDISEEDARALPFRDDTLDAVVTSPTVQKRIPLVA